MNEAEFDQFADEYYAMHVDSIAASGEGPEYFAEYKIIDIAREVSLSAHQPTDQLDILDFGAGIGGSVRYVNKHFPNARLTCLDLSQRSLAVAGALACGAAPGSAVEEHGAASQRRSTHLDVAHHLVAAAAGLRPQLRAYGAARHRHR